MKILKFVYLALFTSVSIPELVRAIETEDFLRSSGTWLDLLEKQLEDQDELYRLMDEKPLEQVSVFSDLEFYNPNGMG